MRALQQLLLFTCVIVLLLLCYCVTVLLCYCGLDTIQRTTHTTTHTIIDMDATTAITTTTTTILWTSLIHLIFEYIDSDFKLLIHREGSTDEEKAKTLSIEVIMRSGMEDYFQHVLLSTKFKDELCYEAASRGHVSTLKWAREHGCYWDNEICKVAAGRGHLDCLTWAREHGCDWNADTCRAAAEGGHLDILK